MNRRQKIIVSVTGIFIVLLILIGLTYGYFLTRITGNGNPTSISVTTANLELVYGDGTDGVIGGTSLIPSNTVYEKKFTVYNNGNADTEYSVYLINVVNTFYRKDDIKYTMSCTTDGVLECGQVENETTFPSGVKQLVTSIIEPKKTHTYTFKFSYKDSGTDQSVDMGKELRAKIQIFGKTGNEYFPYEEGTLAFNVINNIKTGNLVGKSAFLPNLNAVGMVDNVTTANDKILSTANDDYGTSYYFRGNPIDNYVNYAKMCWRVVRIQGDGSVKLILASEQECNENNFTEGSGFITDGVRGKTGEIIYSQYGFKFLYDYYINDYINSPESTSESARVILNDWLNTKITNEEQNLLKDEHWCIGDLTSAYSFEKTGEIVGNTEELIKTGTNFYYSAGNKFYVTKTPSYICETTGKSGEIDINKVGMLSFDEMVYAGGGNKTNSNYYLIDNAIEYWWWGFSPIYFDGGEGAADFITLVDPFGDIGSAYGEESNYLRASVSLKSGVLISGGIGTIERPYLVE